MCIIYLARNIVNGKGYVGKTRRSLRSRRINHEHLAKSDRKTAFHRAIAKYGTDSFLWSVIHQDNKNDSEWMNWLERRFIKETGTRSPSGYNMTDGGDGGGPGPKGKPKSAEHRKKLSEAKKGWKPSEEMLKRSLEAKLGSKHTEESKQKMSLAQLGKPKSDATKEKIRIAALKQFESEEARQLAGSANRGKTFSQEYRDKIREGVVKAFATGEAQKKMSESQKRRWEKHRLQQRQGAGQCS